MSLWSYVEKGWDYVSGAAETAYDYATDYYEGSFLDKTISGASDFLGTDAGQFAAGYAKEALFGKSGVPQFGAPKGARMSGSGRASVGSSAYQASPVDLGYTARVQNAVRTAQNARTGSAIEQTIRKLSTRPSKGPLLNLAQSQIRVSPRSRG